MDFGGVNIDKCRNQLQNLTLTTPQDHPNFIGYDYADDCRNQHHNEDMEDIENDGLLQHQQDDHDLNTGSINGKQQQSDSNDEVVFAKLVDMIKKSPEAYVGRNHDYCCGWLCSLPTIYESEEDKEDDDMDEDTFYLNEIDELDPFTVSF